MLVKSPTEVLLLISFNMCIKQVYVENMFLKLIGMNTISDCCLKNLKVEHGQIFPKSLILYIIY